MNLDDQNIISGLQKGNEKVLKLLYDKYFPSLCSYAFNFIKDEMVSGDIVQIIYTKVWDKRKDFDSIYSIRSFFYLSVRNACLNHLRDQKKYKHVELNDNIPIEENHFIIEEEVHRMIKNEIDQLPEAMKRVFNLTLMDLSIPEIAQALNVSEHTVRNQRARAREILKEKLKDWVFLFFL